jgi:hypothetical protein
MICYGAKSTKKSTTLVCSIAERIDIKIPTPLKGDLIFCLALLILKSVL